MFGVGSMMRMGLTMVGCLVHDTAFQPLTHAWPYRLMPNSAKTQLLVLFSLEGGGNIESELGAVGGLDDIDGKWPAAWHKSSHRSSTGLPMICYELA